MNTTRNAIGPTFTKWWKRMKPSVWRICEMIEIFAEHSREMWGGDLDSQHQHRLKHWERDEVQLIVDKGSLPPSSAQN